MKQNNILRNMTFSNYDAQVSPIYKRLNFFKAQDIFKLELAKLMHKFHDGLLPSIYNGLFQRSSDLHDFNTRYASNRNYFIPSVHSNIGKKLISYKGAVIWREIYAEYKNLPFHHFKKTMCNYGCIFKSACQIAKTYSTEYCFVYTLEHLLNQYW